MPGYYGKCKRYTRRKKICEIYRMFGTYLDNLSLVDITRNLVKPMDFLHVSPRFQ